MSNQIVRHKKNDLVDLGQACLWSRAHAICADIENPFRFALDACMVMICITILILFIIITQYRLGCLNEAHHT